MAHEGRDHGQDSATEPVTRRWLTSRVLASAAAGIILVVALVGLTRLTGSDSDPETEASAQAPRNDGIVAAAATQPTDQTDTDERPSGATPVASSAAAVPTIPAGEQAPASPTPVAISTAAPPQPTSVPAATPAPETGSVVAETPRPDSPAPAPPLFSAAAALATQIQETYGVRIFLTGQQWGATEADQVRNLTAVSLALESLPPALVVDIVDDDGGPLTFLSNSFGRTEDGWQPYGNRAANFYSNEDQGPHGHRAANQVVMQPGSIAQTIAHELVHAFQLRAIAPGEYVRALLTPEMKAFMSATGWRQLVSDEEVLANSFRTWEEINSMYAYDGRALSYLNEHGTFIDLYAPNPLEAYAEAAGLYYAHSFATELPDWPEYWSWFDATLGDS